MELIPVLSTIILVATISTFLLAIGAYILYKIREEQRSASCYSWYPQLSGLNYSPLQKLLHRFRRQGPEIAPQPVYFEPKPAPSFQPEGGNYPQQKDINS